MIGEDYESCMNEAQQAHRDTRVAAVVQERQEFSVQPAQRPDAQDDVQEHKSRGAKRPHEHDLVGDVREYDLGKNAKGHQVTGHRANQHKIIEPLLSVPLNSSIFNAHGSPHFAAENPLDTAT